MAKIKTTKEQIENSISHKVRVATGLTLKMYCEAKQISYKSLTVTGYISKKAARIMQDDGIDVEATRGAA